MMFSFISFLRETLFFRRKPIEVFNRNSMIPRKNHVSELIPIFDTVFDPCIGSKRIKESVLTLLSITFHNIFLLQKAEKNKISTIECHPHFWKSLQQLSIRKQWFLFGQQKYLLPTKFSRPNFHVSATLNNTILNGIFARRFTLYKNVNGYDLKTYYKYIQVVCYKRIYNIYVYIYIYIFVLFLRAFNNTFLFLNSWDY